MRVHHLLASIQVLAVLCGGSAVAQATFPPNQQIAYYIRELPDDPRSTIVFEVELTLSAQAVDTGSVGWRIDEVRCRRKIEGVTTVWTQGTPVVDSSDGLWWVQHADVAEPLPGEFAEPPLLEGTAVAEHPEDPDLVYSLAAIAALPGSAPYANAAAMTYVFTLASEPTPIKEGTDEPVEIDDRPHPNPS